VRQNVDRRIRPIDETPIVPNFFGGCDHVKIITRLALPA
jgi:hypothetical protein